MSGESYWAPSGKKIGSIVKSVTKTNVYGPRGERLGTTDKTGTFDVASRRIANLPSNGLLMARSVRKPRN
jgi:hypothetical protein